jgi:hypothetical protein
MAKAKKSKPRDHEVRWSSHLPRAERPKFRDEIDEIPFNSTCPRCWAAFVKGMRTVVTPKEDEALQQARREERSRPPSQVPPDIKSKAAKH